MTTVVVTGGCGFIGSAFVRLLRTRTRWRVVNVDAVTYAGDLARVRGWDDPARYRFVRGDITDRALVRRVCGEERPEALVNFAAESHVDRSIVDPSPFLETNVRGLQVLLDAARTHGVGRFVHISTDEVYGDLASAEPAREDAPLRPSSPYAASKAAGDLLCLAYRRTYGIPCLLVRSANNYGPWQFPEKLIPLMVRNAVAGHVLPVYGDGGQRRDWLHVADNCRAILRVLERGVPGAVYNVAGGEERTNLEVVAAVCRALVDEGAATSRELQARIRFVPDRPGHDRRYAMDAAAARAALGWRPMVRFDDGLRRTVRWYLRHAAWVERVTGEDFARYYETVYRRRWNVRADGEPRERRDAARAP